MSFSVLCGDITKLAVDAVVNTANPQLKMGGGVCGAIFSAAGSKELQKACDSAGGCDVGDAVITKGFRLPAKFIIHTAGPVWSGGKSDEAELLQSCYTNSLLLALRHGLKSIAFPLISSGIYGCPKDTAVKIAARAISAFLIKHEMDVYLVVFTEACMNSVRSCCPHILTFASWIKSKSERS